MQYTSLVIAKELPIDDIKMMVRGHHSQELRAFKDMIFEVSLEGAASEDQAETLARDASARCFVENTLAKAISVTTHVNLNGKKLVTLARGPDGAPLG